MAHNYLSYKSICIRIEDRSSKVFLENDDDNDGVQVRLKASLNLVIFRKQKEP